MQRPHAKPRLTVRRRAGARRSALRWGAAERQGFTLVEMLVATALVVLIMVMFAEVFSTAVRTLTDQRALGANDQKARTFTDTLSEDLQRLTFRQPPLTASSTEPIPICLGINTGAATGRGLLPLGTGDFVDPRQRGYFYYSENGAGDTGDDVLQFTIDVGETLRHPTVSNPNDTPYVGRALSLGTAHPNQPDGDDGVIAENPLMPRIPGDNAGSSRAAEVTYFLRGGNLYRRVMLLRDPGASSIPRFPTQPSQGSSGAGGTFGAFTQPYPNSFYHDWDYAGSRVYARDANTNGSQDPETGGDEYYFHFHGLESLDNSVGLSGRPLANPAMRFGFHPSTSLPREYLNRDDASGVTYLGRFTHEETSHFLFRWPGLEDGTAANMLLRNDLTFTGSVATAPGPTELSGPRAGDDLLIPNVDAFNVEVWDPEYREGDMIVDAGGSLTEVWFPFNSRYDRNGNGVWEKSGAFVDLGHGAHYKRSALDAMGMPTVIDAYPGRFHHIRNQNPAFGGRNPGSPGADGQPGIAGVDDEGNGTADDMTELGWPGSDDVYNRVFDTWHPGLSAPPPYRPLAAAPNTATWQPDTVLGAGVVLFPRGNPVNPPLGNYAIGYKTISQYTPPSVARTGTGSKQPEWPLAPGTIVVDGVDEDLNGNGALDLGEDRNGNGILDRPVVWQCFDNRLGLEKIRITVRYRDPSSGHTRQVTLIHSFVE